MAGGFGKRLGPLTKVTPKPMLTVAGKPFLEYLLWNLKRQDIRRVHFCIGYLSEQIKGYFGDGGRFGMEIDYAIEQEPAGTGGALRMSEAKFDVQFVVLNGDTLFDVNLHDLSLPLSDPRVEAVIALRRMQDTGRYGRVEVDDKDRCISFGEKCKGGLGLINGGIYAMRKSALRFIKKDAFSVETELFPALAEKGRLAARSFNGYFIDIGIPDTYAQAQTDLPHWQQKHTGGYPNLTLGELNGA